MSLRISCIGRQILYHWCHVGSREVQNFIALLSVSAACSLPLPYLGTTETQVWSQCRETEGLDLRIPLDTRKFRPAGVFLAIPRACGILVPQPRIEPLR